MYQLYIDYFKYLCELHPDMLHTDSNRVFEVISIEEAFAQFTETEGNSAIKFRLIDISWSIGKEGAFEFYEIQGGFRIDVFFDRRNGGKEAQITARTNAEKYATDFAIHMIADSQNGHPLFSGSLDDVTELNWNAQPLFNTGDGSYDGLICTFSWKKQLDLTLDCHTEEVWKNLAPFSFS